MKSTPALLMEAQHRVGSIILPPALIWKIILGIENTTDGTSAIHDQTQQGKMFAYVSKIIDDESRLSVMLSASHSDFQIPNSPGGTPFTDGAGNPLCLCPMKIPLM